MSCSTSKNSSTSTDPPPCTAAATLPRPPTRRDMLVRCANGFGALALTALLGEPARRIAVARAGIGGGEPEPARAAPAALPGEGEERHLPVHGRRAVAGGHVRPQAPARPRARPADQGEDPADAVQQRRQRAEMPLEVPPVRRERHPGQRPVPARRRSASTTWRSSARWSRTSPSTPTPTTSCTPGSGLQGRPSQGAWVTYGLGSECREPARLRRAQRRPDPARRPRLLQQRVLAGVVSGLGVQGRRRRPSPTSRRPRRRPAPAPQARAAAQARPGRPRAGSGDHDSLESAIANYELAFRMQTAVPELMRPGGRVGRDAGSSTASTIRTRRRRSSAGNA